MFKVVLTSKDGSMTAAGLGEVKETSNVTVSRQIKAPRTGSFTVGEGHPKRATLRQGDQILTKVYSVDSAGVGTLKHVAATTGYSRKATGDSLVTTVGSTDPAWMLVARFIQGGSLPTISPNVSIDRSRAMKWLIWWLNGQYTGVLEPEVLANGYTAQDIISLFGGAQASGAVTAAKLDTGIRPGVITPSSNGLFGTSWSNFTTAKQVLDDLSSGLGPEWMTRPVEPVIDSGGVQIAAFDVHPGFGSIKPHVIFEHGMGRRNVSEYDEIVDPTTVRNEVVHLYPGYPNGWPLQPRSAVNEPSRTTHKNLTQIVPGDFTDSTLRDQILADYLAVLAEPRRIITIVVAPDPNPGDLNLATRTIPRPGVDYDLGDVVTFKAAERVPTILNDGTVTGYKEEVVVNVQMRVYGIVESEDDNGTLVTTLTTVAP